MFARRRRRRLGRSGFADNGKEGQMESIPLLLILLAIASRTLPAQSLDAEQQAYSEWLKSGAELERDAATAKEALAARTDRASSDVIKWESARKAFGEEHHAQMADMMDRIRPISLPN